MKIAPEVLARFDRFNAAKKERGKGPHEAQMLLLNAVERADSRCYCLQDTGAKLVLPKREGMTGTEAQCTVPGGNVVSGMVVQVVACDSDEYHAVAIGGASPLLPATGWMEIPPESGSRQDQSFSSVAGRH